MQNILERIKAGSCLLADGAMGTELQNRGLPTGGCPEFFNIENPEIVRSVYRDYFNAGSDIIETNTFGGNRSRLTLHGLADKVFEINKQSAQLAKDICPKDKFVAGSIGPTGEILEPMGTLKLSDAYEIFKEQALALADGGVDIFFVETMMAVEEAEIAVKAIKDATGLPVSATMTFELNGPEPMTYFGVSVKQMAEKLEAAGADIIGANCGNGVEVVTTVAKLLNEVSNLPIIVQPNAGLPEMQDGRLIYTERSEIMVEKLRPIAEANLAILGGCCGTNPEYITAFRKLLNEING